MDVIKLEELLKDASSFPYLALVAFEVGGVLRLFLLLLLFPLAAGARRLLSEEAGEKILVFGAVAGASLRSLRSAARAALPKFLADELRAEARRALGACGGPRRVETAMPRILVESFLKDYLGAEMVSGAELASFMGRATGLLLPHDDQKKAGEDLLSLSQAKNEDFLEREIAPPKPVIFHDGRLVQKPTPLTALLLLLWFPLGLVLAAIRIAAGSLLPLPLLPFIFPLLGIKITLKGNPLSPSFNGGTLIVCNHRTLLDPVFLSLALRRPISAVTFSISRLSELLSPIKTVRLTRNRTIDASTMKKLLREGDMVICPEGTTCREPFLLRFSSLFAELEGEIAPVAVETKVSMFHGTSARGWKGMDAIFFFMNPRPSYVITFLGRVPKEMGEGRSGHEFANYVQRVIGDALGYECTGLTRRDKYRVLVGNDEMIRPT